MRDHEGKRSVLVVDDEPTVLVSLTEFCRLESVELTAVSRLETAEQELERRRFDLVIADIRLRGVLETEGLELLSYIKRKWPQTKVLIITGFGSEEARREAFERGADFYREKPFDVAEVGDIVRGIA